MVMNDRPARLPSSISTDHLDHIASWLDTKFKIPLLPFRLGLDSVVGLIPGVGDAVTALVSLYLLYHVRDIRIPFSVKVRMIFNIAVDALLGAVPFAGDIFDIGWKANVRNVRLIKQQIEKNQR